MIRISNEHKAIFCHIPRTGGTSMEAVLKDWERVNHEPFCRAMYERWPYNFMGMGEYARRYLPDYFTFTIIRNPFDRFLSGMCHANKQPRALGYYWFQEHVLATQKETLGGLIPDYVMRLESIENDYRYIQDKFDLDELPKLNSSSTGKLTKQQVKWVNVHFAEDFKMFGYEKR